MMDITIGFRHTDTRSHSAKRYCVHKKHVQVANLMVLKKSVAGINSSLLKKKITGRGFILG